ncbi:unnamed protein product [Clonostachys rosea f. rosea IK726]|uniref:FAD dependent oxidoreductase domain-containing protein n=2 Tax=Bionectria ochroleuca TaxID=29856 RepID=A0A8H7KB85_BIOOC|nr:unnamed protein product [Clonostachys rosea f. rosea IK726]
MGGGTVLPGFPQPNPTTSYWQIPPHPIANHRTTQSLPTSTAFDYIIIGSGISGAAVAFKLLSRDPSLKILMLEARTAASGASGRNGGHCRAGFWLNQRKYTESFGEDEALKFLKLEEQNGLDIADFVRKHNVDCDFREVETADVYVSNEGWNDALLTILAREDLRKRRSDAATLSERTVWSGQEARGHLGMPSITGAVTWRAYTQNPYRLVCKMLELALEKGLNLQTTTPALGIVPTARQGTACRWEVKTDRGNVHASHVVLATNAYSNALLPGLGATGFLTPARSQVAALRPGKNMTGSPALRGSAGLNDLNGVGDYYMTRLSGLKGEGDILWGGGRFISKEYGITDDSEINPEIATYLHHAPAKFFGSEVWGEEGDVVRDWTGITCYTPDTFPLVGEMPSQAGLWMSVGMNGHGMGMAFRSAEALVEMVTSGEEPEWYPKSFRPGRAWGK